MSEFKVNTITNRDGSYGPQVCGITTFGSSGMTLPSGPTEMRGGRGRAIFAGGYEAPSNAREIRRFKLNLLLPNNLFSRLYSRPICLKPTCAIIPRR